MECLNRFSLQRRLAAFSVWSILAVFGLVLTTPGLHAQAQFIPSINTVAGNGTQGASGNGGSATSAALNHPGGVAEDRGGNLYIADHDNNLVRKVDTNGIITTFAGGGSGTCASATDPVGDGCPAADAVFEDPEDIAFDNQGNVYISDGGPDLGHSLVRKVDRITGLISVYAGNVSLMPGYSGDGGSALNAQLFSPAGIAFDAAGDLYIDDYNNQVIREVRAGVITTVAGTGTPGYAGDGGPATSAELKNPEYIAVDGAGNLYIGDTANNVIRKVTAGIITTIAGNGTFGYIGDGGLATSAELGGPRGIAVDAAGNLYIADYGNDVIRKADVNGNIATIAGTQSSTAPNNGDNGIATNAYLNDPSSVSISSSGDLYIADRSDNEVRKVNLSGITAFLPTAVGQPSTSQNVFIQLASGVTPTIAVESGFGDFNAGSSTCTSNGPGNLCSVAVTFGPHAPGVRSAPLSVTATGRNFFFPLTGMGNGPAVALTPGVITTYNTGAGGLGNPQGVAADAAGNLYIADTPNNQVLKVPAGGGTSTPLPAIGLIGPNGVAVDAVGNVYIADTQNNRVIEVPADGGAQIVLGRGFNAPTGVAVDEFGNIYIADTGNQRVVELSGGGAAQTVIGAGWSNPTGVAVDASGNLYVANAGNQVVEVPVDGGPQITVAQNLPGAFAVAVDAAGNLYVTENSSQPLIQRIDAFTHVVTTIAGSGAVGYSGDNGTATQATFTSPAGLAMDGSGDLYIADYGNHVVRKVTVVPSATVNFMSTSVGAISNDSPQTASVTNIGNEPLTFTAFGASANFAIDFNVVNPCSVSASLAAGDSCPIGISFSPTVVGNLTGNATMTDNALNVSGSLQTIPLGGAGFSTPALVPLTVIANNAARVYGAANPAFTGQILGGGSGTFVETFTTIAQQNSNVGSYPVTPGVTGANLSGYNIITNNGTLTINKAVATLVVQSNVTSMAVGSTMILTATVTSSTTGMPTGTVTFSEGATQLGTAALNAQGLATLNVRNLPDGNGIISGVYGGDINFIGTSAQLSHAITAGTPGFLLTANPSSMTTKQGKTTGTTLTFTSQYGFSGAVTLSCLYLPAGASCQFGSPTVMLNGSNQAISAQLTITTWGVPQSNTAANHMPAQSHDKPTGLWMAGIFWLPGMLLGCFLGADRKKMRSVRLHMLLVLIAGIGLLGIAGGLTGCAGLTPDAATGTYQITVVAASATGQQTQRIPLLLTITK